MWKLTEKPHRIRTNFESEERLTLNSLVTIFRTFEKLCHWIDKSEWHGAAVKYFKHQENIAIASSEGPNPAELFAKFFFQIDYLKDRAIRVRDNDI